MDREAREGIINVKVSLLRADSTVVDTMMTGKCDSVENFKYIDSRFQLTVPGTGHFILRFEAFGYITAYKDIEVKDSRRNGTIEIGVVYMMKDRHVLEGVTVTATKDKDGDARRHGGVQCRCFPDGRRFHARRAHQAAAGRLP
jgi:hypothetical protein